MRLERKMGSQVEREKKRPNGFLGGAVPADQSNIGPVTATSNRKDATLQPSDLCFSVLNFVRIAGYLGDDEANAMAFSPEGWLKTCDLCCIDQEGFLFVVDSRKVHINYKMYQVPPAELDIVLHSLPEIVDAAVLAYPHEEAEQISMALVLRQPGSKVTEVMDHVTKQVAPYKKIRKVAFVDSIPKSPTERS